MRRPTSSRSRIAALVIGGLPLVLVGGCTLTSDTERAATTSASVANPPQPEPRERLTA